MKEKKPLFENCLEKALEKRNESYYQNFLAIKNSREADYSTHNTEEGEFTTHGPSHLAHVQGKIGELLKMEKIKQFNDLELYTLLCAICLHDISMAYTGRRADHANTSADIVEKSRKYVWIDDDIKYIIGNIIRSHGMDDFEPFLYQTYRDGYSENIKEDESGEGERVNVGALMALLRIGDIMDWAYDRAPETVREGQPIVGESFYYWFRHQPIKSITPKIKEKKIIIAGQNYGYFTCRILKEEFEMLNRELDSDSRQLSNIDVKFDCFSFNLDTEKKMEAVLKPKQNKNVFHPFISYEEDEYLRLQGRDEDEDKLIQRILSARRKQTVQVLTGESGNGKTSLLKARIMESFREMGFEVKYFDDSSDALKCLKNAPAELPISTEDKTKRYLVILDQVERSFSQSKKDELGSLFRHMKELASEEEVKKRIVYFVLSVPDIFLSQLMQRCAESSIEPQTYYLQKVDIGSVITAMLRDEGIRYEKAIIDEITNYLLSTKKSDVTNVHILFQMLLRTDTSLLAEKGEIVKKYATVGKMVDSLIDAYFEEKFQQLTKQDKILLKRACNDNGESTRRVDARAEEREALLRLADHNFIRFYEKNETNETYEIVHDILAKKFYEDVLEEPEKEILALAGKIYADSLDNESLAAIKKNRDSIAERCQTDEDIANLVFSYMTNYYEEFAGEADWWMQKYIKPDAIISNMVKRIEKGVKNINLSSIAKTIPPILECARDSSDRETMKRRLIEIAKSSRLSYIQKCVAAFLLEKWGYSDWGGKTGTPVNFGYFYQNAYVDKAYEGFYKEAYCYLLHYDLVEQLIREKRLDRLHFEFILRIFLTNDKSATCLYLQEHEEKIEDEKLQQVVVLLTPEILERLKSLQGESSLEFQIEELIYKDDKFGYEYDAGKKYTDLKLREDVEALLKFSYKEDVEVVILINRGKQKENSIAFLKKTTKKFQRIFTPEDVANTIRQYKVWFANHYCNSDFRLPSGLEIPTFEDEKTVWRLAGGNLQEKFQAKNPLKTENGQACDEGGDKLLTLYASLNYLNDLNLRVSSPYRFCRGKVVLMRTDKVLKNTKLYDHFYIELEQESRKGERFDPYSISGAGEAEYAFVEFQLVAGGEPRTVKSCEIKRELTFHGNGSAAISVCIGLEMSETLKEFNDSFSFQIIWDDKVNRVSKAIDAWEYELSKVLTVLKENEFITDIFVFGDIEKCRKTLQICKHFCKESKGSKTPGLWENIDQIQEADNTPYFQNVDLSVLSRVTLHIVPGNTSGEIAEEISNYFLCEYNTAINLTEVNAEENLDSNEVEHICKDYLESIGCGQMKGSSSIQVDCIDDAYKAMLALLVCFGNRQVDSSGANILDIRGFSLVVRDIDRNGFHLSYRRADINEYYEKQWENTAGTIKEIADTVKVFNVNQVELITKKLDDTIKSKVGCRKLAINFYNPTSGSIGRFETPSLLNCFLIPRYQGEQCILDVIFVWRTNECVLGLPMSLEASIRWIHENIIPKFGGRAKIGNYTYFGASMHCADNFIMRQMITSIISADQA